MKKDIAIFINVRKNSRRCPNKLLRPFAGSSLIDILLSKVAAIKEYPVFFAAAEEEFFRKAQRIKRCTIIRRTQNSADAHSDAKKIFEALNDIPYTYVAWINPSHPFLSMKTFLSAIREYQSSSAISLTSVKRKKGWLYFPDGSPITQKKKMEVDTVLADWVYEVAHAFHMYPKAMMLKKGVPWTNKKNDPLLYEIPLEEAWDIDHEEELIMVEALYKAKMRKKERA